MLKKLTANIDSFNEVNFRENDLNIILATTTKKKTTTGSRNGLGKSTLVNLIAFCLGFKVDTRRDLPLSELPGWEWTLTFSCRGKDFSATRGADNPNLVRASGDFGGCPIRGSTEALLDKGISTVFKVEEWQNVLRWLYFGLEPTAAKGRKDAGTPPDYISLMTHFVRLNFDDPVKVNYSDKRTTSELAVTYLLGLDWQFLAGAKEVRAMRADADNLINAAKVKLREFNKERDALREECRRIEAEITEAENALADFDSIPQANLVEGNLTEYAVQIAALDREIIAKGRLLSAARESKEAGAVSIEPLVSFYEELGAAFADGAKKTLEEVKDFHRKLTYNRDSLIERQIELLEDDLRELQNERRVVNEKRKALAESLNAKAAMEDYRKRANALMVQREELQKKNECLELHDKGEELRLKAEQKRNELLAAAEETYKRLKAKRNEEDAFFREIIESLYADSIPREFRSATTLGIEIRNDKSDFGITYKPQFWGDRSEGKKKLKTFAFDLTILNEQHNIRSAVDFMVHDSILYDSADARQFAKALKYAAEMCHNRGLQYICVVNSDNAFKPDFLEIFDKKTIEAHKVLELSDDPSGKHMLLGDLFPKRANELPLEDSQSK